MAQRHIGDRIALASRNGAVRTREVPLTTVGDEARRSWHPSEADDVNEVPEDLGESEALEWASMGAWTDVAIRTKSQVLKSTMSALNEVIEGEEKALRRSRTEVRIQIPVASITSGAALATLIVLLSTSSSASRPLLAGTLGIMIGTAGFTIGMIGNYRRMRRQRSNEVELMRRVLAHEADYRRRISERESR
jgi:hypothetical protein